MRTRVLVVDDEPSVRETLIANLELDDRLEVVGAAGGVEALALVDKERWPDQKRIENRLLVGRLQQRYGMQKDEAEREVASGENVLCWNTAGAPFGLRTSYQRMAAGVVPLATEWFRTSDS